MKMSQLDEKVDQELDEVLPAVAAVGAGLARGAAAVGGAACCGQHVQSKCFFASSPKEP